MPYNADQHEKEILEFWRKNHIFEKSVSERPEDKPFVFYDGPPFATGLPHYGHILSSVIKDVVPRYWTMKGYRVRRRWGWDCHGLPIESLIEKELKISGKKDIEEKIGVKEFNEACRSKVLLYTSEWKKMVERIGRWVEFDNAYKTMDVTYMESVWWALRTIWDRGMIYEGRKVLMYCTRCETPVSKAEVAMDHSYHDVTEEAMTVKFGLRTSDFGLRFGIGGQIYLLAWTTTPWTLPGNVALAVGEELDYKIFTIEKIDGQLDKWNFKEGDTYIIANDTDTEARVFGDYIHLLEDDYSRGDFWLPEKQGKIHILVKNINVVRGERLVGLEYQPLYDMPAMKESGKKAYYVSAGDFVSTEEGTGIVHTAVIYGEDDYNLGLKMDLPMVPMLDSKGHYNEVAPEFIRGRYYKQAEKDIKQHLNDEGLLFAREAHTHSYPHCWRCDTPLIYNAVSSWFINIQKVKDRMIELNERVNWFPEHLKHGRFLNIVKEAPDWNISRNRYWATALPFWRCQNGSQKSEVRSQKCVDVCIGSIEELKRKAVNFLEVFHKEANVDLHKDSMDQIVLTCEACGGEMHRVPEVLDSWVEAASMPFAEWHYPFENKETFEKRFPGQYIAEYIAQTRTWFYYMHVMAVMLYDNIAFENVVTTGTILNDKGEKLSKSKRNFTDPWIIIEQYGMDALRYYLMTSVVMQGENVLFKDNEVKDIYNKVINLLWNVVEFYRMYGGGTSDFGLRTSDLNLKPKYVLDAWILARLNQLVQEVTIHMDGYDTVKAGRPIKDFIDDLSTWYLRRSRDRFKNNDKSDAQAAIATLHQVLLTLAKIMAPFTPFMAEKIYQEVRSPKSEVRSPESVHLEDWPTADESQIDVELLEQMTLARKIVEMGLSSRKDAGIKVRQPLAQLAINNERLAIELRQIVADELNVKEVVVVSDVNHLAGHWVGSEEPHVSVALNIDITPELKKEGLVREITRAINQIRKEKKLTPADRVVVHYQTDEAEFVEVLTEYKEQICLQTNADRLELGEAETEVLIGDKKLSLSVVAS